VYYTVTVVSVSNYVPLTVTSVALVSMFLIASHVMTVYMCLLR